MPFLEAQKAYAEHGIPLFPVKITADGAKRPSVRNYQRIGVRGSAKLVRQFGDAPAFGFVCGGGSKITVLDVDSSDEKVFSDAMDRHGKSPLIVRTARRRFQAWYRWNGEHRLIRPHPGLPIDILGNGVVVAPNSRAAHGQYEIVHGSLDDLDRLPRMLSAPASIRVKAAQVQEGGRNSELWKHCMREAHYCDTFDVLLDVARTVNDQTNMPSLPDAEVVKIAHSAWGYTERGANRFGQHGAWFPVREVDQLIPSDQDCFCLLAYLRAHNGPRAEFFVANGLAKTFGWTTKRLAKARKRILEIGELRRISRATTGNPALYRWVQGGQI